MATVEASEAAAGSSGLSSDTKVDSGREKAEGRLPREANGPDGREGEADWLRMLTCPLLSEARPDSSGVDSEPRPEDSSDPRVGGAAAAAGSRLVSQPPEEAGWVLLLSQRVIDDTSAALVGVRPGGGGREGKAEEAAERRGCGDGGASAAAPCIATESGSTAVDSSRREG